MIIRIVGEGQWQVPDTEMGHLNRICLLYTSPSPRD